MDGKPQKSSATVPYISTSNSSSPRLVFCASLFAAALQSVYFREYLSVFSGNELAIGMILSVWLVSTGLGTMLATRVSKNPKPDAKGSSWFGTAAPLVLIVSAATGIIVIRASRVLFLPGELLGPHQMLFILAASEIPFTFVTGFVLGTLFSKTDSSRKLYRWDNAGALLGALLVYACVLLYLKNAFIAAAVSVPLIVVCSRIWWVVALEIVVVAMLLMLDHSSVQWKYSAPVQRVIYGYEGEIAALGTGADTTYLQNGIVYKSTMQTPSLEQAVHIPLGERPKADRVLVILNKGHTTELAKYAGLSVDVIETEPAFASAASTVISPEMYKPRHRYDIVFVGAGIPRNAATNRFYTQSFFLRLKSMLADSGIVTFSLPFSENYLSPSEQRLYDALQTTLATVFRNVLVFPGEGYTFMASNGPLTRTWNARVSTRYLASSIIPAASEDRITKANLIPAHAYINTQNRPITLFLGLLSWLDLFSGGTIVACGFLAVCFLFALWFAPKTRAGLSVASSGMALGAYTVGLLLIYQSTYGALYSRISILLVALAAGFTVGAFVKKLPLSDAVIGLYCGATLALLAVVPNPPALVFYALHAGAGLLCGAQIVSRKNSQLGEMYAADLFGGAIGMAITSTILAPLVGIVPVAVGICGIKLVVEAVAGRRWR
jgi:hypothetical protein